MAPRGVPIFPRQDGIAFGSHWERSTVALIESIHDAPEPGGEPALAQWLQRDAHPHILTIKAQGCRRGLFRLCQADGGPHDKRDQEGKSELCHSADTHPAGEPRLIRPRRCRIRQAIRSRSVTWRQWAEGLRCGCVSQRLLPDRREPFVPLRRQAFNLLELQDRWFALSDDCRPLALLGSQYHRSRHRGTKRHSAVICQSYEFFLVKGHLSTPTLKAGLQASTRAPRCPCPDKPTWLRAG